LIFIQDWKIWMLLTKRCLFGHEFEST
jgi:hypothetical protein